jgi:hypothetical protein
MALSAGGVRQLAGKLAPDVLDEAVAEAREQARARLAATLAEEIVAAALAEEATPPHTTTRQRPSSPRPDAGRAASRPVPSVGQAAGRPRGNPPVQTGLYAYGITDAATAADDIVGLDGRTSVETLCVGEAALVASTIDLDLLAGLEEEVSQSGELSESGRLAELAGRHDRVMRRLLDRGPILPLRFGTVLPDRPAAERLLRVSADELTGELDRVRGHREWGLRVLPGEGNDDQDEDVPAPTGSAAGGAAGTGESGTAYLSARRDDLRRAALREERLTGLTRRIHGELAALASDVAMRSGRPGPGRLNAAYLVASAEEDNFLDVAGAAARELTDAGCEAHLTGPWPPYSFVRLTLGEASDA